MPGNGMSKTRVAPQLEPQSLQRLVRFHKVYVKEETGSIQIVEHNCARAEALDQLCESTCSSEFAGGDDGTPFPR
jgi:hypothetical protein